MTSNRMLPRAIACLAMLAGVATADAAQFVPISTPVPLVPIGPPLPLAATLEAPTPEIQSATTASMPPGTRQPTFVWSQGGLVATTQPPLDARYFMICLQPRGSTGCHWGGRWYAPANTIPRVPASSQPLSNRYRYTYTVPSALLLSDLDQPMEWIVGSCADQRTDACTLSAPKPVLFTTRNLKAQPLFSEFTPGATGVSITARLSAEYSESSGRSAPSYDATIAVFDARMTSTNRCLTNVQDPAVQVGDQALLRDGTAVPARQVTVPSAVVAILPGLNPMIAVVRTTTTPVVGASVVTGTMPGTGVMWNGPGGRAFAVAGYLDGAYTIAEYDESDNNVVDCVPVRR